MQRVDVSDPAVGEVPAHRNRNVISVLVGVVGFCFVWVLAAYSGVPGNAVGTFLNFPTAAVVIGGPLVILVMIFGWAGVVDAIGYVFRKPAHGSAAADAATFFQLWAAFALASGFLATLVGLMMMLRRLDDPSHIGLGMATALLSQLYGVFIAVICIALAAIVARRHKGAAEALPIARRSAGVAGITVIAGTMTILIAFGILMLSLPRSF